MDPLLVWPRTRLGYLYRSTIGQCDSVQIVRFSTLEQVLVSNIREIAFQYLTRRLCSGACYFSYQRRYRKAQNSTVVTFLQPTFPKSIREMSSSELLRSRLCRRTGLASFPTIPQSGSAWVRLVFGNVGAVSCTQARRAY